MIIGIVGTLAAGKGAVVDRLKQKGFAHYSSSGILVQILKERGLPLTRDYMSPLAEELLQEKPGGVLGVALARAQKDGATKVVLEAIHRMSEADFVRSVGGKIVGVDADLMVRYERTLARADGDKDTVTLEQFKEHVAREEEGKRAVSSNIRAVLESADVIIMNNGTKEALHAEVDRVLEQLK